MKYLFVIFYAVIMTMCFAEVPNWIKRLDKEYPLSQYIRAEGEGKSIKLAQSQAVSTISLYFDTKTDVMSVAMKQSSEVLKDGSAIYASNASLQQMMAVSSVAEFFCLNFTESYHDEKHGIYRVLAYINKKEAAQIYKTRIDALMLAVNGFRSQSQRESEPFLAAQSLYKAETISHLAEQYIKNETTIVPADSEKYKESLKIIALIPTERATLKKQLSFSIIMNQKEKRYDPLFSTVASILEKYGYSYSLSDSNYKIIIDMTCVEESADAGEFVRPSLDVLVVNDAGSGVYSYSKAYPRTGGKSLEQSYTRAVSKAKQDLEENFLAE